MKKSSHHGKKKVGSWPEAVHAGASRGGHGDIQIEGRTRWSQGYTPRASRAAALRRSRAAMSMGSRGTAPGRRRKSGGGREPGLDPGSTAALDPEVGVDAGSRVNDGVGVGRRAGEGPPCVARDGELGALPGRRAVGVEEAGAGARRAAVDAAGRSPGARGLSGRWFAAG